MTASSIFEKNPELKQRGMFRVRNDERLRAQKRPVVQWRYGAARSGGKRLTKVKSTRVC
jgi:hypothetical protein